MISGLFWPYIFLKLLQYGHDVSNRIIVPLEYEIVFKPSQAYYSLNFAHLLIGLPKDILSLAIAYRHHSIFIDPHGQEKKEQLWEPYMYIAITIQIRE